MEKQINQDLQSIDKNISTDKSDIRVIAGDREGWRRMVASIKSNVYK